MESRVHIVGKYRRDLPTKSKDGLDVLDKYQRAYRWNNGWKRIDLPNKFVFLDVEESVAYKLYKGKNKHKLVKSAVLVDDFNNRYKLIDGRYGRHHKHRIDSSSTSPPNSWSEDDSKCEQLKRDIEKYCHGHCKNEKICAELKREYKRC